MTIGIGFAFILMLLFVLAVALAWYWWRQPPFLAPLPSPFCDRDSQEDKWRERYDDERLQVADAVLLLVCDAFCFSPDERYKLQPDDQVMDVYRGQYPPGGKLWSQVDCMEMESLMFTFNKKFRTRSRRTRSAAPAASTGHRAGPRDRPPRPAARLRVPSNRVGVSSSCSRAAGDRKSTGRSAQSISQFRTAVPDRTCGSLRVTG